MSIGKTSISELTSYVVPNFYGTYVEQGKSSLNIILAKLGHKNTIIFILHNLVPT